MEDEERALQVIREKIMERRLPMIILDAEYQYDRHKCTQTLPLFYPLPPPHTHSLLPTSPCCPPHPNLNSALNLQPLPFDRNP